MSVNESSLQRNAGMANRQGDVDVRFAQVSAPSYNFALAWLDPSHQWTHTMRRRNIKTRSASSEESSKKEKPDPAHLERDTNVPVCQYTCILVYSVTCIITVITRQTLEFRRELQYNNYVG